MTPATKKKLFFFLAAALAACGNTRLTQAAPHAIVDQRAIDFGPTPVLFPVEHDVLVSNGGRVTLHVSGVAATGDGFEVTPPSADLVPGDTLSLRAIFRPPQPGSFSGKLSLQTDDPDLPLVSIDLAGVGTQAGALSVSPSSLDFGRVGEGQTAARQLTLSSTGAADLYLGALTASPDAYGFIGSVNTPATLAAGSQVAVTVRFSPTPASEATAGTVGIDSSDPAQPHLDIPLTAQVNHAPVPQAAASLLEAPVGSTISLDGSASTDADGDLPLRFAWSLDARPIGSSAQLTTPDLAQSTLQLDQPGIYSVLLEATDSTGLPSLAPARVDIRATPPQQLLLQLVWDAIPPDLDLHLLQAGAALNSSGDCYWANPSPWSQGPVHEGDKLTGYGPETIAWDAPVAGTFSIAVVYASDHGAANPATSAQLRVYSQGVIAADLTHAFKNAGEVWNAGTISWPPGTVQVP